MGTTAAVSQISDEDVKKHCIRYKLQTTVKNLFSGEKYKLKLRNVWKQEKKPFNMTQINCTFP